MGKMASVLGMAVLAGMIGFAGVSDAATAQNQKKTATKTHTGKNAPKKPVKKQAAKKPAPKAPVASSMDADWPKTFALIKNHSDPIGAKLITWIYVTETNLPVAPHQLMEFVRANPDWPKLHIFRRKIEENLARAGNSAETVSWFQQNPPTTYDGEKGYIDALIRSGKINDAKIALAKFWKQADLNKNQTAALAGAYKSGFAPHAHAERLDHLIWEGRYSEAEYMLAFVAPHQRAAAQARIALGRMSKNADVLLAAVPEAYQNGEGLLFERLRWRRRKDMDAGAMEMIAAMPAQTARPDMWWGELGILARRRIEAGDYAGAYKIAAKNQLTEGIEYATAEWLMGWLQLNYLKDPVKAYYHFDTMYKKVSTAISHSRGAYWAARAAEKAFPGQPTAMEWEKIAAKFPSTFYGQLSYEKLYGRPTPATFREPAIAPAVEQQFQRSELARAVRVLNGLGLKNILDPFLARMIADAKTRDEYSMVAKLARETERYYYAVQANKDCQQQLGQFLFTEGYPTLPPLPLSRPEKSLVHAIIHRESMFNPKALSPVGARGLMQLMPGTAKMMAKATGEVYNLDKLTADPRYNTLLGEAYLQGLVDDYAGFYPMAIAAYNAGPGRVREWNDQFGDPRRGQIDVLDWIEHIPIYETRNYIQRVMESYYIYRLRFGENPRTIYDFLPRK